MGMALAITLEEIGAKLTEGQKERIWQVFDKTMTECLAEVPLMTRVQVKVRPPTSITNSDRMEEENVCLAVKKKTLVSLDTTSEEAPLDPLVSSSVSSGGHDEHSRSSRAQQSCHSSDGEKDDDLSSCCVEELSSFLNDPQLAFPVYRYVDGVWTIILKDPEVTVRDEFGEEESLTLDYLKVYLQQMPTSASARNAPSKVRRNGANYPGGVQNWKQEGKQRGLKRERS